MTQNKKYITILGSSGSIGKSALDVISASDNFAVYGLSVHKNIELLARQAERFKPRTVAIADVSAAAEFEKLAHNKRYDLEILSGDEGVAALAEREEADAVLLSVVGNAGIKPALAAIRAGKRLLLANKEALVSAGELIINAAEDGQIIPVDSEHSAIFQCLRCVEESKRHELKKIILTASGGAFRGLDRKTLENVTAKDALKHPTWSMGDKITIDSATLMNKGLEVIEASWLFDVDVNKIEVVVHPESIIHSMIELADGSVLAQMCPTDMRFPIHYAMNYPNRVHNPIPKLDFYTIGSLTFKKPDFEAFPCLRLAYKALLKGGTTPCVLNEVNHLLVNLYLEDKIKFYDISDTIDKAIDAHSAVYGYSTGDLDNAIKWSVDFVRQNFGS